MSLLLLACSGSSDPVVRVQRPGGSIVFITLDTTRADALGAYGAEFGSSPRFDALAARGVRFEWCLSHVASTLSSHASMMTGLDPHQHAIPRNGFPLPEEIPTVAERLSAAGYDTIGAVSASVIAADMGMAQGFRLFDDELSVDKRKRFEAPANETTDKTLAMVDQADPDKPLFLWVHYYDAHNPYEPPRQFEQRFVTEDIGTWGAPKRAMKSISDGFRDGRTTDADLRWFREMYQAEVAFQDAEMARLLDGLEARGVLEDASIVITADHGEAFFEDPRSPVGHGPDIDLPLTRVPLLVVPRQGEARVVQDLVGLSDVGPTLLGLAGLEPVLGEGRDLGPALRGEALPPTTVYLEATKPAKDVPPLWNNAHTEHGVAQGEHLLVRSRGGHSDRLYALDAAQTELSDSEREARLAERLTAWEEAAPPFRDVELSADVVDALKALGYLE